MSRWCGSRSPWDLHKWASTIALKPWRSAYAPPRSTVARASEQHTVAGVRNGVVDREGAGNKTVQHHFRAGAHDFGDALLEGIGINRHVLEHGRALVPDAKSHVVLLPDPLHNICLLFVTRICVAYVQTTSGMASFAHNVNRRAGAGAMGTIIGFSLSISSSESRIVHERIIA